MSDYEICRNELNQGFEDVGLLGARVFVSGKIRPTLGSWSAFSDDIQTLPVNSDELGEYRLVDELDLVASAIDSKYALEGNILAPEEARKFGFTFRRW